MKVKQYNLHLDFVEHMRSLTALEYILTFRDVSVLKMHHLNWLYSHEYYVCDVFGRVQLVGISGEFGYPPLILAFRRWNYGHLLYWHDPIFPNTPAWNELIACAARNAESASHDSLVDWLIHLDVFAIQSMAWYNQSE